MLNKWTSNLLYPVAYRGGREAEPPPDMNQGPGEPGLPTIADQKNKIKNITLTSIDLTQLRVYNDMYTIMSILK